MKKEIKFRGWGAKSKVMIEDVILAKWQLEELRDGRYILMQYTGLKDRNGVEIYESNYVRFTKNNKFIGEGVVVFKDCCFHIHDDYELLRDTSAGHYECEVIGNIYENPELLKHD